MNNNMQSDDELLKHFMDASRLDIEDNGFSDRVMRHLPQRARCMNRIWTAVCCIAAIAVFVLYDGFAELRALTWRMAGDMSGYLASIDLSAMSLTTALSSLAVLALVGLYNVLANQRLY